MDTIQNLSDISVGDTFGDPILQRVITKINMDGGRMLSTNDATIEYEINGSNIVYKSTFCKIRGLSLPIKRQEWDAEENE